MGLLKGYTKQEISWMMYDWANSAHSVIVVTLLPIFFDTVASYTADSVSSMSTWGYATSIAMAIVAIAAPFLGVFGDIRGMRKRLFSIFMILGVVAVALMSFTPLMDFTSSTAAAGRVAGLILTLYILSVIGFDASAIYYDAFLTDITTPERMDRVSTMGYGLGYIGGSTIPLVIFLVMNLAGVPMLTCLAVIFAITAVWWLVFSLPLLKNCRQTSGKPYEKGDVGRNIRGVGATVKEIIANKPMLVYILAYFFYIDGVHTVISMATTYGTNLGLDSTGMMLALLLVQVLGLPFCLLYIRLSARFGARFMVGVGVCVYMFICVFAFFMRDLWQFWVLAVLCATSQGGIQALSRSMFGKLIPDKDRSGEFFGFFDIFGKFSSIMGPALVGVVSAAVANGMLQKQGLTAETATAEQIDAINAASSPFGIVSILLIIGIGAVLFFAVLPRTLKGKNLSI
ncbi:MFS transporter [Gemmiger formicilis]|uniref:MFS transporter n=1 Tax=Gemmiger formicilis TaxID=745368 RepID=UPI00195B67FB|nr:MFS transporter [Gemmiger formicilis]MBM6716439.1 MFS transporter [Gemmiger formicilis]